VFLISYFNKPKLTLFLYDCEMRLLIYVYMTFLSFCYDNELLRKNLNQRLDFLPKLMLLIRLKFSKKLNKYNSHSLRLASCVWKYFNIPFAVNFLKSPITSLKSLLRFLFLQKYTILGQTIILSKKISHSIFLSYLDFKIHKLLIIIDNQSSNLFFL
jgi:hypothetical protein